MSSKCLVALAISYSLSVAGAIYEVDPNHSVVEFKLRHSVGVLSGRFHRFAGSFRAAEKHVQNPLTGSFKIACNSIQSGLQHRDEKLQSAQFLNCAKHAWITFQGKKSRFKGRNISLSGTLTLNGVSKKTSFMFRKNGETIDPYRKGYRRISYSAIATIDRTHFGIDWNQTLDTGGLLYGRKVHIKVDFEATTKIKLQKLS